MGGGGAPTCAAAADDAAEGCPGTEVGGGGSKEIWSPAEGSALTVYCCEASETMVGWAWAAGGCHTSHHDCGYGKSSCMKR